MGYEISAEFLYQCLLHNNKPITPDIQAKIDTIGYVGDNNIYFPSANSPQEVEASIFSEQIVVIARDTGYVYIPSAEMRGGYHYNYILINLLSGCNHEYDYSRSKDRNIFYRHIEPLLETFKWYLQKDPHASLEFRKEIYPLKKVIEVLLAELEKSADYLLDLKKKINSLPAPTLEILLELNYNLYNEDCYSRACEILGYASNGIREFHNGRFYRILAFEHQDNFFSGTYQLLKQLINERLIFLIKSYYDIALMLWQLHRQCPVKDAIVPDTMTEIMKYVVEWNCPDTLAKFLIRITQRGNSFETKDKISKLWDF